MALLIEACKQGCRMVDETFDLILAGFHRCKNNYTLLLIIGNMVNLNIELWANDGQRPTAMIRGLRVI